MFYSENTRVDRKNDQPVIRTLSGSRFSRHQFAFLLCLIESFPEKLKPTIIYDPEFNQEDKKIIGKVEILQKKNFYAFGFSCLNRKVVNQ